jgi:hypothetical protein
LQGEAKSFQQHHYGTHFVFGVFFFVPEKINKGPGANYDG